MAISFNVPNTTHTSYLTLIDNETFQFEFRWSTRASVWYLDVLTNTGEVLTRGAKLVPNIPILRTTSVNAPKGLLVVVNNTTNQEIPNKVNIGVGKDFELIYFTEEEVG